MQKNLEVVKKIIVNTILIAILALFSVSGMFKGFVKSLFSLVSLALATLTAFFLTSWLAGLLVDASFLERPISNWLTSLLNNIDERLVSQKLNSIEQMFTLIEECQIPFFAKTILLNIISDISFSGEFTVASLIIPRFYNMIVKVLVFAVSIIVVYLILKIAQFYVCRLLNFKSLRVTDKALGFIFGLGKGMAVYIIFTAVLICVSQFILSDWLINKIEQGYVSALFYHKYGSFILGFLN